MGQGFGVAQGFAIAGRSMYPRFDSYCIVGDGELQEGPIWEAVMYSAYSRLDNLCLLVDRNNGQLDIHDRMVFAMPDLQRVFDLLAGKYTMSIQLNTTASLLLSNTSDSIRAMENRPAIICNATKGYGAFSDFFNKHKVAAPDALIAQEIGMQSISGRRGRRSSQNISKSWPGSSDGRTVQKLLLDAAQQMRVNSVSGIIGTVAGSCGDDARSSPR
jgi:transketolase